VVRSLSPGSSLVRMVVPITWGWTTIRSFSYFSGCFPLGRRLVVARGWVPIILAQVLAVGKPTMVVVAVP
jgi:hypothetical protein